MATITVKFYAPKKMKKGKKKNMKRWKKAIDWWVEKIAKKCGEKLDVECEKLDLTTLPEGKTVYADDTARVADDEMDETLIGADALREHLGAADDTKCFYIAMFQKVKHKPQHAQGSGSVAGKFEPPNTLAAKKKCKLQDRRHEIGHLFGLKDNDGGIMDKHFPGPNENKDAHYGDKDEWGKDWCDKIKTHLGL